MRKKRYGGRSRANDDHCCPSNYAVECLGPFKCEFSQLLLRLDASQRIVGPAMVSGIICVVCDLRDLPLLLSTRQARLQGVIGSQPPQKAGAAAKSQTRVDRIGGAEVRKRTFESGASAEAGAAERAEPPPPR